MLFRALMNRMCRNDYQGFGGQSGSEPGARIPFQKYPGLVPLLSNLLAPPQKADVAEQADTAMVTERVFPALELIAEKVPGVDNTDDAMLLRLIREHLKSPVWGIREHAARVYASLLVRENIVQDIQFLLGARDSETQNYLHGESLCIRYSLRRLAFTPSAFWNGMLSAFSAFTCFLTCTRMHRRSSINCQSCLRSLILSRQIPIRADNIAGNAQ